jgi:hypothetical protein
VHGHPHLFTLRLWQGAWDDGQGEWRGQVRHVLSGEARYFREWSALIVHLLEMAGQAEASQGQAAEGEDGEAG